MNRSRWCHHIIGIRFFLLLILSVMTPTVLAGTTERVSVASDGSQGNDDSGYEYISISADSRYVAFMSSATSLHPDSTREDIPQVYVRDREDGVTHWVSKLIFGTPVLGSIRNPMISGNGRIVAYDSIHSQIVPNDTNYANDVFIYDIDTGTTQRVSLRNDDTEGSYRGDSVDPSINYDGTYIAFESDAHNLVSGQRYNLLFDIFLRNTNSGSTTQINVSSSGDQASGGNSLNPSISASARWVAFESRATNLVSGDTNLASDIFVRDTLLGYTERVSVSSSGVAGNAASYNPTISADGRYVAFESLASNLAANDNNTARDVFVHDRQEDKTYRVSISTNGAEINTIYSARSPSISANGRFVAFHSSADNLVQDDDNDVTDVFVHDLQRRVTERVSVASDGGQGNLGSFPAAISANGTVVAFESAASNLVPGDSNRDSDVFVHVNSPPVAVITGPSGNVECAGYTTRINLDSSSSYDPQGETLSYYWTLDDGSHSTATSITDFITLGDATFTLRVTDPYGLTNTDEQNLRIVDTTAPTISAFNDVTLEATSTEGAYYRVYVGTGEYRDRCNSDDDLSVLISPVGENDYYPLGTTPVTVTVTDPSSNSASQAFDIIVQDTTPPVLTVPPDKTVEATAIATPVNTGQASATDLFGPVTIKKEPNASEFGLGTSIITWTATDANGNSSSAIQRITVEDTTPPTYTIPPPDITVEAQGLLTFVVIGIPYATDIFFPIAYDAENVPPGLMFPLGVTEITWTATDANGNSSSAIQRITVRDTTAPVITAPPNRIAEATALFTPVILGQPVVFDIFLSSVSNNAPVDGFPLGTTMVTWVATDTSGNTSAAIQRVTVHDTTPPVLTLPPDVTAEATGPLTSVQIGQATATDIFGPVTISHNAPANGFPLGTTEVTWLATDANGNSNQGIQRVTVLDRTAPSFTLNRVTDRLWPANHKMVLAATVSDVYDTVDPVPLVNIHVTSSEPDNGKGDGNTTQDWDVKQIGNDWQIWLRAERSGKEDGRRYAINVTVSDSSGNQTTDNHTVMVPHDRRNK